MNPVKPPGHTCPAIDEVRELAGRLTRARTPETRVKYEADIAAAMERVRDENQQLRQTYIESMAFQRIAVEAIALVRSGYDGTLSGPEVEPLIRAVVAYGRHKKEAPDAS